MVCGCDVYRLWLLIVTFSDRRWWLWCSPIVADDCDVLRLSLVIATFSDHRWWLRRFPIVAGDCEVLRSSPVIVTFSDCRWWMWLSLMIAGDCDCDVLFFALLCPHNEHCLTKTVAIWQLEFWYHARLQFDIDFSEECLPSGWRNYINTLLPSPNPFNVHVQLISSFCRYAQKVSLKRLFRPQMLRGVTNQNMSSHHERLKSSPSICWLTAWISDRMTAWHITDWESSTAKPTGQLTLSPPEYRTGQRKRAQWPIEAPLLLPVIT
jgi:hypothetical protein